MATTAPVVGVTYNTDIYGFVRRLNRFIVEIFKAQSSGVSVTQAFDATRALSYLASIEAYRAWVTSQPILDLPETAPQSINLPVSPELPLIENESLYDLATLMELMRDELANSQSSRLPTNLMPADNARLTALLAKANSFINDYIGKIDPLDLPESSPMEPMSGKGNTGV